MHSELRLSIVIAEAVISIVFANKPTSSLREMIAILLNEMVIGDEEIRKT